MGVFSTQRPESYDARLQRANEIAIMRKNTRLEQRQELENKQREALILESLNKDTPVQESSYEINRRIDKRGAMLRDKAISALESRLVKEGYEKLFNNVIFEFVYRGFWADDSVKESTIEGMYESYEEVIENLSKMGIKPVSEREYNPLLMNIKNICMEAAKETASRIVKEVNLNKDDKTAEDIEQISFDMSDAENLNLDNNLAELNADELAQLVKDKVLQVVNDEKTAQAKKEEFFTEIDAKKKELQDEIDSEVDSLKDEVNDETSTEESVSITKLELANLHRKLHRNSGNSLFECIMMGSIKNVTENVSPTANKMDVMDGAFMETMMTYTVLETLSTLNLYKFSRRDIDTIRNFYK